MKKRLLSVDALRGVAALVVVFYHAREMNWIGISEMWRTNKTAPSLNAFVGYATFPFIFGFAAVSLFFVLSGYCIHRPHAFSIKKDSSYKLNKVNYFSRRLWRIYPVLTAALTFTYLLDIYTKNHHPHDNKLGDNSLYCFLINLFSLQNIAGPTYGTNVPLWTLGMEIHFYLLYPLLLLVSRKIGAVKTLTLVGVLSLSSLLALHFSHSNLVIFLPFWFTWTVGFLVAEYEAGLCTFNLYKWRFVIGLAFLAACALVLKNHKDLAEPLFAPAFGLLLLWSIGEKGQIFWSKYGHLLARVGIVSFSLYAFHYPFIIFFRSFFLQGAPSPWIIVPVLSSLLCIGLASIMFWLVERWSLKIPNRLLTANLSRAKQFQ